MNFDFLKEVSELEKLYDHCRKAEQLAVPFPDLSCTSARGDTVYATHGMQDP